MKMLDKHKSKLHKGFLKQVKRQDLKPETVKIIVIPILLTYSYKHSEYRPLKRKFHNNKWNGMNLKNLYNRFTPTEVGCMYSKRSINKEGKYILSFHGKSVLKKKRLLKNI